MATQLLSVIGISKETSRTVAIGEELLLLNHFAVYDQFQRHFPRVPNPRPFNRPIGLLVIRQRLESGFGTASSKAETRTEA